MVWSWSCRFAKDAHEMRDNKDVHSLYSPCYFSKDNDKEDRPEMYMNQV
jgi:hypothetical protein